MYYLRQVTAVSYCHAIPATLHGLAGRRRDAARRHHRRNLRLLLQRGYEPVPAHRRLTFKSQENYFRLTDGAGNAVEKALA